MSRYRILRPTRVLFPNRTVVACHDRPILHTSSQPLEGIGDSQWIVYELGSATTKDIINDAIHSGLCGRGTAAMLGCWHLELPSGLVRSADVGTSLSGAKGRERQRESASEREGRSFSPVSGAAPFSTNK